MFVSNPIAQHARVVPVDVPRHGAWQFDLIGHIVSNPRHLQWLLARPRVVEFTDGALFPLAAQARARDKSFGRMVKGAMARKTRERE